MTWLITGVAGFIGSHLTKALLERGERVVGIDNLDPYYDPHLKLYRLEQIRHENFRYTTLDIADEARTYDVFREVRPTRVVHLAAQPGVRHAMKTPVPYARTNLMGTVHVFESARLADVEHVVYASSSSVYGESPNSRFSVRDAVDHPTSLYAATKRSSELLAHAYSSIYGLPTTGLRFFTVYGPWGRPDMAYYSFAESIARSEPVHIFGDGSAVRDFTFVDDIVEGIIRIANRIADPDPDWTPQRPNPATSRAPYRIFNIGRGEQVPIEAMIRLLEQELGREAIRVYEADRPGDLSRTHAEVEDLEDAIGFRPKVSFDEGIREFIKWFREYHRL